MLLTFSPFTWPRRLANWATAIAVGAYAASGTASSARVTQRATRPPVCAAQARTGPATSTTRIGTMASDSA